MEQRNLNIGLLIFRLNLGGIKGMLAEMGLPAFLAYGVHFGETIAPNSVDTRF